VITVKRKYETETAILDRHCNSQKRLVSDVLIFNILTLEFNQMLINSSKELVKKDSLSRGRRRCWAAR
jgi:hypothetical protein